MINIKVSNIKKHYCSSCGVYIKRHNFNNGIPEKPLCRKCHAKKVNKE